MSGKREKAPPQSSSTPNKDDELEYANTGVPGLDELLDNKGIPTGHTVSLIGAPGAGKTTLSLQFLENGITMFEETGIYVSLDENLNRLIKDMKAVGIDLRKAMTDGLSLVDASHLITIPKGIKVGDHLVHKHEFSLISLIENLRDRILETNAKRLVIDPISMLTLLFPSEIERRVAVADLIYQLSTMGATTLLLSELKDNGLTRSYQLEDYLSQGAIVMRKILRENGIFNIIQVEKMRGVQHDTQPRFYRLERGGISIVYNEPFNMV